MERTIGRRGFLQKAGGLGALAALGDLGFLKGLRPLSAEEVRLPHSLVRLRPEIEPVVRLLEETPRERLLERVGEEIRSGLSYQRILAALMLAGVRNIQPRPVGFKFHAVLVVNSAHLASLASADADRWLPLFWAIDHFKNAQADQLRQGDWRLGSVEETRLPSPTQARRLLVESLERWDEAGADAAVAQMARTAGAGEVFEVLWRYGARDFRDIGHKGIYSANAWRTLQVIGWEHAEPIVRSLASAILDRGSDQGGADATVGPWFSNLERLKKVREGWVEGSPDDGAASELASVLRGGSPDHAGEKVVELLNRKTAASTLWDGVLCAAGELMARQSGIIGLHSVTSANALRYIATSSVDPQTRLLALLQAAGFVTLFRTEMARRGSGMADRRLDQLETEARAEESAPSLEEIFAGVSRDRAVAARRALAYLQKGGSALDLMAAARRLIFLKGNDSHDYKLSSALLEDYFHVGPTFRDRYLASGMFNLRGSGDRDNALAARTRAALRVVRPF